MKANEFVKENPWVLEENMKELKEIISDANDMKFFCLNNALGHSYDNHGGGVSISIADLKRLVESHELVESCGGIDVVKRHLKEGNVFRFEEKPLMRQAISDVESCQ